MSFFPHRGIYHNEATSIKAWKIIFFTLPFLLFLPVIYYSLQTPFALVDDYGMCYFVEFLDNQKRFSNWLHRQVLNFGYGRYRPFFDLYNMVTWKVFGATPWLHHLSRWLLHFASLGFFSAAFIIIARDNTRHDFWTTGEAQTKSLFIPLALLIYIWLFFPNVPASRLGPQEVYTVFFLGLCNLTLAHILIQENDHKKVLFISSQYGLLYLGFLGLSLSKEINIAVMLWIILFYYGLLSRGFSWKRIAAGVPLIVIFFYTIRRIFIASANNHYGVKPVTLDLITANLRWIASDLFQARTSLFITAGFFILIVILLCLEMNKLVRRHQSDNELFYILLVVGQFLSLYLVLSTSWAKVLRYWYVIIPVFTTLLAFSARSALELTRAKSFKFYYLVSVSLVLFIVYFVGCNYYNFLLQSVAQHSLRQAESELITEISDLHDANHYVYIRLDKKDPDVELLYHLVDYYRRFAPRFYDKQYVIHTSAPETTNQAYFIISRRKLPDGMEVYKHIQPSYDYPILDYTYKLSSLFQGKKPRQAKDAGVHILKRYEWLIYRTST